MNPNNSLPFALALLFVCASAQAKSVSATVDSRLQAAIESQARPEADRLRDQYRHPQETLSFFGIRPNMTVVEIWPSSGWYAQILAPYLRDKGHYYAATPSPTLPDATEETKRSVAELTGKFEADPARFGKPVITEFQPPQRTDIAPAGTADLVVTFRNVHNWIAKDSEQEAFNAFFAALKPGGSLGIVEHRGKPGEMRDEMKKSGYVPEAYVKAIARKAGFRFVASSKVNNNPSDTKDYPDGVWTLPPTLRLGDQDRAKY